MVTQLGTCGPRFLAHALVLGWMGCIPTPEDDKSGADTAAADGSDGEAGTSDPTDDDPGDDPDSGEPDDSGDSGDSGTTDSGGDSGDPDTGDTGEVRLDAELCDNGVDDDWNGTADCADPACMGVGSCDCIDTDSGALVGTLWTGSTTGAGDDVQGECTANPGGPDVQVLWTPPEDGCYELSTEGSDFDTTLAIGQAWCGGPTLACNDDAPGAGVQSRITLSAREGRSVLVLAEGYDTYEHGELMLTVAAGTPFSESDDVDVGMDVGTAVATGSLSSATTTIDHPCSDVPGASTIVQWEAPSSGTWTFTTVGSDFDASVTVFGQCAAALMCDDHLAGDRQASVEMFLSEGERVHLAIGGVEEATGSWVLNIDGPG